MAKKILASIGLTLLSQVVFYITYLLAATLITFLTILSSYIPVIKWLVNWFYSVRGDKPILTIIFISVLLSYALVKFIIERITHNGTVEKLTYTMHGILIVIGNVIFMIINIVDGMPIIANIALIITGIVFFFKRWSIVDN